MWQYLLALAPGILSSIFGGGGGKAPQTFDYMPGMEQFWKQFQQRLKAPPEPYLGMVSPERGGLPPAALKHIAQSPFPMWKEAGLPFLGGQQGMAMQKYGVESQRRQQMYSMLAQIGAALSYMYSTRNKEETGLPDYHNLFEGGY